MRWKLLITWVVTAIIAGVLGYVAGAHHERKAPARAVVAVVNGDKVTRAEFDAALRLSGGQEVLRLLCVQKIVHQEAKKAGFTISNDELEIARKQMLVMPGSLQPPAESYNDPTLRPLIDQEVRTQLLLRKLALRDVSETWKRHIYELFKPELTQYDVYCIFLGDDRQVYEQIRTEFEKGVGFDKLSERFSTTAKANGGHLGWWTDPMLQRHLGPDAAEAVVNLKLNSLTEPIHSRYGWLVIRVAGVRDRYEDLKPAVEDLFVGARSLGMLQRFISEAELVSTYGALKDNLRKGTSSPSVPTLPSVAPSQPVFFR